MTIITECPSCDEPVMLGWEGGRHGWFPHKCSKCGKCMWIEATRLGGVTLDSEDFFSRIVRPEDRERVRKTEDAFMAGETNAQDG